MSFQKVFLSARARLAGRLRSSNWLTWTTTIGAGLVVGALIFALDYAGTAVTPESHLLIDFLVMVAIVPLLLALATRRMLRMRAQAAAERASAIQEERRNFSRDLHDTVAQKLSYLHLKLDQLAADRNLVQDASLREELEKMREVTNEAYEEVYCLLSTLRFVPTDSLAEALKARVTWAGRRAGFGAHFTSLGHAQPLTPFAAQQIIYIVREALTNVEKHAKALNVWVVVDSGDSDFSLHVADDGQGFDPASVVEPGHYGLRIMRERAEQIGGTLRIQSYAGGGTQVLFTAPIARVIPQPEPDRRSIVPALPGTRSAHD